jgi:hypothetical protein
LGLFLFFLFLFQFLLPLYKVEIWFCHWSPPLVSRSCC